MKNSLNIVFLVCLSTSIVAQSFEKELSTEIEKVTIHLKGAEIIRTKEVRLNSGRQNFVFTGLSPKLNPKSVQVTGTNEVQILSITSKINFLKEGEKSPIIEELRDSMELIMEKYQSLEDEKNAFEQEKKLLMVNQQLRGNDSSISVDELTKAADFYRERFKEINTSLSSLKKEQKDLNKEKSRLQNQLNELNAGKQPTSEIYVVVNALTSQNSNLKLRYIVDDAGWSPIYDLVAKDLTQDISLKYRALAFNNSGTDWENVKITLSTADPYQGAGKPKLNPWVLTTAQANAFNLQFNSKNRLEQDKAFNEYSMSQNVIIPQEATKGSGGINTNIRFETIEISELNMDFEITQPYDIPSDSKPYSIDISDYLLSATYKHFAVPKLDRDAFLVAQITGWEDLDLISGPMNVYQGEKYVGLANLDTKTISDTLELSLGRDQKVTLKREKRKEFSKNRLLGDKKISAFSYRISVKNNHTTDIHLELVDQVPISKNKEISIDIKEISNAEHNAESGRLVWEFDLSSGGAQSFNFSYSVKHPKNMGVKLFRSKQLVLPRYF